MHGLPRLSSTAAIRVLVPALALVIVAWSLPAQASIWPVGLAASSKGQAQARSAPAAPTSPSAACSGLLLSPHLVVTWTGVPNASTYTVYQSTTAATGPFVVAATGITTTTWTSPVLGTGGFWFQISATVGSNWVSPHSVSTSGNSVILGVACL
jgi:hypothetical protein